MRSAFEQEMYNNNQHLEAELAYCQEKLLAAEEEIADLKEIIKQLEDELEEKSQAV